MNAAPARTTVSVVVLAFNEEKDLRSAVASVLEAVSTLGHVEIEIIIVNDGSTDGTAVVANALEREYPFVHCVHHARNQGFGAAFRSGLDMAKHDYITFFPGDNIVSGSMLRQMLLNTGKADLVCCFTLNMECRGRLRYLISSTYSFIFLMTFNLYLRSIHSTPVYPVRRLRALKIRSQGYALPSEVMVKLMREGGTYLEIPGILNYTDNKSSALRMKNLGEVIVNYLSLLLEVFVTQRRKYSGAATRVIAEDQSPASVARFDASEDKVGQAEECRVK